MRLGCCFTCEWAWIPLALVAGVMLLATPARSAGDTLRLKDGRALVGDVKREPADVWAVRHADGTTTRVSASEVAAIEMGTSSSASATRPTTTAATTTQPSLESEKLESLRRSVEAVNDISQILERYRRFIASDPPAPVRAEAEKDLSMWQQRQADGLVRFAGQWISADQRQRQIDRAIALAVEAQGLVSQGRVDQAQEALRKALALDPSNPTALFIRGVQLHAADDPAAARKCFEGVLANLPRHGPSLANLGLILWQLDAILPAVNCYDQAMVADPQERAILDNVAEVIQAIPRRDADEGPVKRMTERFVAQDRDLQQRLAQERGLYRWGSTWVDQEQMKTLKAAEQEIRRKLDDLQDQFDRIQDRVARIDEDIEANEREMRRLIATSYFRDSEGRLIRRSLPRIYYDLKEDNEELQDQRDEQERKLDELRALAREVESRLPVPRYTGVQKLLGAEYAPMPRADASASADATAPSTQPAGQASPGDQADQHP